MVHRSTQSQRCSYALVWFVFSSCMTKTALNGGYDVNILFVCQCDCSFVHFLFLLAYAFNMVSIFFCVVSIFDISGIRSSSRMSCTCPRLISTLQCFRTSDSFLKLPIKYPFASHAEYLKPFMPRLTLIIVGYLLMISAPFLMLEIRIPELNRANLPTRCGKN